MRLFLDANVIFSAALTPAGRARALFELAALGELSLLASPHAVQEAERNIRLKHADRLGELRSLMRQLVVTSEATPLLVRWADLQLPPGDAPILAAAVHANADMLVTGDRSHFGHLFGKTARGVEVVSLADALGRLLG